MPCADRRGSVATHRLLHAVCAHLDAETRERKAAAEVGLFKVLKDVTAREIAHSAAHGPPPGAHAELQEQASKLREAERNLAEAQADAAAARLRLGEAVEAERERADCGSCAWEAAAATAPRLPGETARARSPRCGP